MKKALKCIIALILCAVTAACTKMEEKKQPSSRPFPSAVSNCQLGPNPIWQEIFEGGNLASPSQSEMVSWQQLDQIRSGIQSDADLQQYAGLIISQLTRSGPTTPFGVVGKWLRNNQGVIEIVDTLGHPQANAGFRFEGDGTLVIQLRRSFLMNNYALSVAFSLVHEFTHAAYQKTNTVMPPVQSFCAEYQPYSVAMAAYLSIRSAFHDESYEVWIDATDTANWWLSEEWVRTIETHLDQTIH